MWNSRGGDAPILAVAVLATAAGIALVLAAGASASRMPTRLTNRQVEIALLSTPRRLAKLAPALIDPRTRLLRTNTRATCRGLGAPIRAGYRSFRCVVSHARTRLLLRYTMVGRFGATLTRLTP
jgi:hypothetical protein